MLRDARALGLLGPGPVEPHLAHARAFGRVLERACAITGTDLPGRAGPPGAGGPAEGSQDPAAAPDGGAAERGGLSADGVHQAADGHQADEQDAAPRLGSAPLLDLGSGGGLPGLVLAVDWPQATVALLDAHQRRTTFLTEAASQLGVSTRVVVLEGRAEALGRTDELRGRFLAVAARSFGRPAVTAECAAPFLQPGGTLVVSEPPAPSDDSARERWPASGLQLVGLGPATPVEDEFHFVVARQVAPCPDRFPRRVGTPTKRPLF